MATSLLARLTIDDDLTRRRMLGAGGGLAAGLLIGGCADDPGAAGPAAPTASASPGTRTVRDAQGPVEVPVAPQRVIFNDAVPWATAMALGFPPENVGGVAFFGDDQDYHRQYLDGLVDPDRFTNIAGPDGLNIERIAAVRPDLCVAVSADNAGDSRLRELGVPIFIGGSPTGGGGLDAFVTALAEVADVLNLPDAGADAVRGIRARVAALADGKAEEELPKVAVVYHDEDGAFRLGTSPVLVELDLLVGGAIDGFTDPISTENLVGELAEADLILLAPLFGTRDEAALRADLAQVPLWPKVRAVAAGNAVFTPTALIYERSLPGVQRQIDIIAGALARYRP